MHLKGIPMFKINFSPYNRKDVLRILAFTKITLFFKEGIFWCFLLNFGNHYWWSYKSASGGQHWVHRGWFWAQQRSVLSASGVLLIHSSKKMCMLSNMIPCAFKTDPPPPPPPLPIGKINLVSQLVINFEQMMQFVCPLKSLISLTCATYSISWMETQFKAFRRGGAVNPSEEKGHGLTESVWRADPGFACVC